MTALVPVAFETGKMAGTRRVSQRAPCPSSKDLSKNRLRENFRLCHHQVQGFAYFDFAGTIGFLIRDR